MKVKEAVERFSIKKEKIYELGKMQLSGVVKNGREWVIPDDTEVLLSVEDIRVFLYHLLQYKNNNGYVFPRKICPDDKTLIAVINQQYRNGFIGATAVGNDIDSILNNIKLTEYAIDLIIGKKETNKIKSFILMPIILNQNIVLTNINGSVF